MKSLFEQLSNEPSPVAEISSEIFAKKNLRLLVKRDDLLHQYVSGNKWRKLKYNLLEAERLGHRKLVTFGGAYSNHLAAVAAAGKEFGFSTMGIVRGEKSGKLNPTLMYVEKCGMDVRYVSRANFRNKSHNSILQDINVFSENVYVIPEGGANCLALKGCGEIVDETETQLGQLPDYFFTACGTGATLAGIADRLAGRSKAVGVAVLKGNFLKKEAEGLLASCGAKTPTNMDVLDGYHHGGYAKFTPALIDFINNFKQQHGIPLDPIYTGKLFFAVFDLAEKGFFEEGSTILLVHTGGLQGIAGFNERFGNLVL